MMHTTEVMLGMISVGTGNDWARMFNIPTGLRRGSAHHQTAKNLHPGCRPGSATAKMERSGSATFINIAGMGFGARVVERSNRMKDKGKSGSMLYFYNIFTSLMGIKLRKPTYG